MIFVCLAIAARAIQALQYVAGGSAPLYWPLFYALGGLVSQTHEGSTRNLLDNMTRSVRQNPASQAEEYPSLLIFLLVSYYPHDARCARGPA